jgi:hypothetical protein
MPRTAIFRNQGRAFGVYRTCRDFQGNSRPATPTPHRCALLDEPLAIVPIIEIRVRPESVTAKIGRLLRLGTSSPASARIAHVRMGFSLFFEREEYTLRPIGLTQYPAATAWQSK